MDLKLQWSRLLRLVLVGVLVTFGALTVASTAHATENYLSLWRSTYPDSASADNLESSCTLCHAGSRSEFNGYGWDFKQQGFSFSAIESFNSDGDPGGAGNLEEINADTQPGWTDGANNVINGGAVSSNEIPAAIIAGTLDPNTGTLDPNIGAVTISKNGDWGSGFQGVVVITNDTSDTIGWWSVTFEADFTIDQIWHGQIVSHTGGTYVVKGYNWNRSIAPGGQVSFGFNASPGNRQLPSEFTLVDLSRPDNVDDDDGTDDDTGDDGTVDDGTGDDGTGDDAGDDGTVDDGTGDDAGDDGSVGDDGTVDDSDEINQCSDTTYGPRMLKLLTRVEYQNSIEDLVDIDFDVSDSIPFDVLIEGYFNNAFVPVTESHVDAYMIVAEKVAAWSAERNFANVVDCGFDSSGNAGVSYEECQDRFLNDFATRVFRRPLTSAELSTYQAVFDDSLSGGDIKEGLELGMTALLTAPQFLYRSEVGTAVGNLPAGSDDGSSGNVSLLEDAADVSAQVTMENINDWGAAFQGSVVIVNTGADAIDDWRLAFDADIDIYQIWNAEIVSHNGSAYVLKGVDYNGSIEPGQQASFGFLASPGGSTMPTSFTVNGGDSNTDNGSGDGDVDDNYPDDIDPGSLDSDSYVLSDYEMAGFLSYTITGSTPDQELLTAAGNGELGTKVQIQQQITRLLATDRARQHLGVFAAQWLGTDEILTIQKDTTLFPDFTDAVRKAMAAEVKAFFTNVFYDADQGFGDLFSADYVFVNRPLANYYGLGDVGTDSSDPNDMVMVDAVSANRGGLLTMGAFMAIHADLTESSPIKRAHNIRARLLCQDLPQPDATIASFRAEEAEKLLQELDGQVITNREFIATITKEEPCATCHRTMINPLGFGFEDYDASGRYRSEDANGLSIDSSGTLIGVHTMDDGESVDFYGTKDGSNMFAGLESAQSCFSANVFRYAMDIGHDAIDADNDQAGNLTDEEKEDYQCSVNTLTTILETSDSMADLFTRLGTLDLVRFRKQRER